MADDVSQDCLLGADFLSAHGFTIDLKLHVLSGGSMSTSLLQAQTMYTSCCQVSILNSVIRPEEEKIFWGEAHVDCSLPFFQSSVLEPKDGFEERHQLLLARVLVTPRNQMVTLRAADLTSPGTLYKGTTIAQFFPFSKTKSCSTTGLMKVQTMSSQDQLEDVFKTQQANLSAAAVLGIDLSTMDRHQKVAMEELVEEFADVFSVSKYDLGRTDLVYHRIKTKGHTPIKQQPRHLPIPYLPTLTHCA